MEIMRISHSIIDRVQGERPERQVQAVSLALLVIAEESGYPVSRLLDLGVNIKHELEKNDYNKVFNGFKRYVREELKER